MGEDENGSQEGAQAPVAGSGTEYVVQQDSIRGDNGEAVWRDVSTINVPSRSKRSVALQRAIDAGEIQAEAGDKFRLLDAYSAEVLPINADTKLVVG